jgi:putative Mg2+ transporter-C (MgtC) family protein
MSKIDYEIYQLLPYLLPKIIVATICGGIIGIEREFKQKTAGIRTNILICVGVTLLTAIGFFVAEGTSGIDPTRIIGQIVTGIGFLGGGVIMKNDDKIVGVTTAAFIWVISSIGVLIGVGAIMAPILLTIGLLLISLGFEKVEKYIKKKIH